MQAVKRLVKSVSNVHRPDGRANVFLFSTPRSGSTWLMELIWSQPGFKYCNEPLNIRDPDVRRHLGLDRWEDLFAPGADARLRPYFEGFCGGRLRFKNPNPFVRYYRPLTHRIVFKEIHAGGDRIEWFAREFGGRVVYLLRHPIAVSRSRKTLPTLTAFLDSDYGRHFTPKEIAFARRIVASGSDLERGVLSWCLQNAVPLRDARPEWVVVTYEQLVLDPEPVIVELAGRLDLPAPDRMRRQLTVPSGVKAKSDTKTRTVLEAREEDRPSWLVEKWRAHVDPADEARAMGILERFELDLYPAGDVLPAERLWIGGAIPRSKVGSGC